MRKKYLLPAVIMAVGIMAVGCGEDDNGVYTVKDGDVIINTSVGHNPIAGYSETGEYTYGGDPSVLVDGDTVYLYTGHDVSNDTEVSKAIYNIPEYLCYSSTDLKTWTPEGSVMSMTSVKWATDDTTAWASQVAKHYDEEAGKDKYYLYFCCWDRTSQGKQSIGVAVSDSPTGPFEDIGHPLVQGTKTTHESNAWNDIDPTVWIETDENGEEHRYMAWGNSKYFICELNEDMTSVKDVNGDGQITYGEEGDDADILNHQRGLDAFTEAPWIYRRQDENGNYYGDYYVFYANGWRERMAYATTDDLMYGEWDFGDILMVPNSTSNTNHMAVFDFKGKTYFVYHNGSLPGGNGYRRSACITELHFNEDGSIEPIPETTAGLNGTIFNIALMSDATALISHEGFINSRNDRDYPIKNIQMGINTSDNEKDSQWVIVPGLSDGTNDTYVSIQSENKPGLYITANDDGTITLGQNTTVQTDDDDTQTFHTVEGLAGDGGVSFESVSQPGMYITVSDGNLILTDGSDADNATFEITILNK